jgi:hypothetical protein
MTGIDTSTLTLRTIVRYALAIILVTVLIAYIIFQARFLIQGPTITLTNEPSSVENSHTVTLTGQARNIAKITLNDRPKFTDTSGYFSEALVLENGYTIATITATDRYGRETRVVRTFVYTPTSIIPE